jgi:hypothetical protein
MRILYICGPETFVPTAERIPGFSLAIFTDALPLPLGLH